MEDLVNILLPVFNEEESIEEFIDELSEVINSIDNFGFLRFKCSR